jgi:site-specific recombinase XerD
MPQHVSRPFQDRRALLRYLAPRYQQASPAQKTLLLDSFVEWTGYSRKYAIELLNHGEQDQQTIQRHRVSHYRPSVQQALFLAWKATHYVCAKRLLPSLPSLMAMLERLGHVQLTEEERCQLLAMSVSTAERYLRTQHKPRLHGLSTTTPGPWRKARIPVRIFSSWEENRPGFVEMDLVAHCGEHLDGRFLSTLTVTDLATSWTECLPLREKSAEAVLAALVEARRRFPFPLLGIDTDSGSEFLNMELIAYCEQEALTFMHSRSGIKNDQCHVEQKNGAVVRATVGCARLEGAQAYAQLGEVYRALRLMVNYVQPSLKLRATIPQGDRVRRVYDVAQTPLQRVLTSGVLSEDQHRDLSEHVQQIDPLALSEHLDALRYALWASAYLSPGVRTSGPAWPHLPCSLETDSSVLRLPTGGTGHQEGPSSCEEIPALVQTHPESGDLAPDRAVSAPVETRIHDVGFIYPPEHSTGEEPLPLKRLQRASSALCQTEPPLLEGAMSHAGPFVAQAPSLPEPALEMQSGTAGEQKAGHLTLMTIEQAIAAYLQEIRAAGRGLKTLQWHHTSLRALRLYVWRQYQLTDVASLTRMSLQTWVRDLPIALSGRTGTMRAANTVVAYARSARAFCNWLVQQGYVPETPFPPGALPHVRQGLPRLVEQEVFRRLLHACRLPGSPDGPNAGTTARNRAILWLLLDTGLSVSELCRVRLTDVDCTSGMVTVHGAKGTSRCLPLSADGQRAVFAYLNQVRLTLAWKPAGPEAQDRLLLTKQRRPLTKNSLTLMFARLSQRAECTEPSICPSMLRDTYAIRFLQAGGELAALQEQLGVADITSVRRYQRFCDEQRKRERSAQEGSEKPRFTQRSRRGKKQTPSRARTRERP